jgi:hypothetical protein
MRGRATHEQEQDDTDEVLPVRRPAATVREGDSDERGTLHDPRQGVPHEREELEESAGRGEGRRKISGRVRRVRNTAAVDRGGETYFSLVSGSLLGPKTSSRRAASSSVRPFSSHLKIGGAQDKSKDGAALGQSSGSGEEGLEGHALEKLENLLHDDVLDVDLVLVVKVLNSEVDLRPGRPRERGQSSRPEKIVGSRKREERTVSRATRACWSPSDSDRRGKERRGRSSAGL